MVALYGRGWKLAPSLAALVQEANMLAPNRSTRSDGSIGDPAHAARTSDHNPADGWVCAVDLTDDDAGGMDIGPFFAHLSSVKDQRVKYLIHNRQICKAYANRGYPAWAWQPYTGSNPHTQHGHVSIWNTAIARNDLTSWFDTTVTEGDEDLDAKQNEMLTYVYEAINEGRLTGKNLPGAEGAPSGELRSDVWRWSRESVMMLRTLADTEALATAISAKLSGAGSTVSQSMLENALRNVLGGLDDV